MYIYILCYIRSYPSILSFFPQDFRQTHSGWWFTHPSVGITIPNTSTWKSKKCSKGPNHQPALNKFYAVSLAVWPSAVSQGLFSFSQLQRDGSNTSSHSIGKITRRCLARWYTCWKIMKNIYRWSFQWRPPLKNIVFFLWVFPYVPHFFLRFSQL